MILQALIFCCLSPLSAAVATPGLVVQRAVLPNGLTVLLREDRAIPIVAVNIWYKVGSKNEEAGKTGFAHLFEHYMFEGSAHSPAGEYFKKVFGMGGETNANTTNDRTDYYAVVPSENLEEVLRLESDRMGFLNIDQAGLDKQRAIVKNEKRLRENQPYGASWEALNETAWDPGHPYRWPVIGSMKDLDAASLADVKKFHDAYYLPNNAVLVVSGDHDSRKTLALIEKWFGGIPAGPAPAALGVPAAAPLGGRREVVVEDDKAQLPMILLAYRIPGRGKPGWQEASVAAAVLGGGRTSRLVQSLQYDQRLVLQAGAEVAGLQEDDLLIISAVPAAGVAAAKVEAAIRAEIDKLSRSGVSAREMARVKASLRTSQLNALQEADNIAVALAEGQALSGDPVAVETDMKRVIAMDPAAPRDAVRKYLTPDNTAAVLIKPKAGGRP